VSATVIALPLGPYTLPIKHKAQEDLELRDESTITAWPLHLSEESLQTGHRMPITYNADPWVGTQDMYHTSTAVLWPTVSAPDVPRKENTDPSSKAITEPIINTYLQPGTEQIGLSGGVTPLVFYTSRSRDSTIVSGSHVLLYPTVTNENVFSAVSSTGSSQLPDSQRVSKQNIVSGGEDNVPVIKSTFISEIGGENHNISRTKGTPVSINVVPKNSASEDNSFVVISKDLKNVTQSVFNSSKNILSHNSNSPLNPSIDSLNSYNKGMDKPPVNIPRLMTRDLRNNSESSLNMSSQISILSSHALDQQEPDRPLPLFPPLPQFHPPGARTGKSAGYFHSQLHPLVLSTISPLKDGPDAVPFPPSSDKSEVMQGYKQGPKSSDDFFNPRHVEASIKDSDVSEHGESGSKITWISRTSPVSGIALEHTKMTPATQPESNNAGIGHLEDVEMADSPYQPPENSTIMDSRPRTVGDSVSKLPPISHELVQPIDKATVGTDKPFDSDRHPASPREKGQILKVIPPLMTSSKVMNTSSHNGRQSDNRTKSSYIPHTDTENVNGNTSVGSAIDTVTSSTTTGKAEDLPADPKDSVLAVPSSVPVVKQVSNATTTGEDAEGNETTVVTVLPTVVPVSNGRVAAAAPSGSHHRLDAASITGISLGILVFAALVGKIY
jgi:hypothetical protein